VLRGRSVSWGGGQTGPPARSPRGFDRVMYPSSEQCVTVGLKEVLSSAMLKPTTVELREKLEPKYITIDELRELLDASTRESNNVIIEASWPGGQQAKSQDPALLREIYNPHQLEHLRLFVMYEDGSHLNLTLMSSWQTLSADRGRGLEYARQVNAQYKRDSITT
jgi:hypothetical protein